MGKILIPGSSGGGIGSDDVTASKAQVLQGYKTVTTDSDDEIVEGAIQNRGNVVDTVSFENAHWESKFVARMEEGYYSQAGQWKPCLTIPYAVLAGGIGVDAGKMLDTLTISGVRGTIPVRGYHGPDSSEMWLYPQEGGYVVRIEDGYYHKGGQWKPYVIAPTSLVKGAVNYHPEATLNNTTTCGEQGQIKMVDTKLNNYTNNQARNIGIDSGRGKLWMELGHGNAYYYKDDNVPHVETDASKFGTAGADSVLQWQTATSQHGINFQGTIPRWICNTGDVISAVDNNGFAWDDSTGANRGRGIVTKIPNGHFIQGANYVFLASPNLQPWNIRQNVNVNGVVGTMVDYSVGRPVFENATFNTLYVGGVANKDFPEAGIYRDRTSSASNYSRYAGGTTINVSAGSNFHLWSSGQYVGFVLDRAILFTFFRQLKITYKLDVRMNTGSYNRKAGVDVYVHLYDAANRSSLIGGMHKMHSSSENAGSTYNGDTYEMIVDTSSINRDAFVALCASAYSDYNMSSAIGSVTFTKIELIN
nr:hypothetical protein [uncultured Lachnoanaerobaculum sp.]